MPRAVKFDGYGGIDVLRVVEVDRPVPGPEQVIIRMKAAGINPGEAAIREGAFAKQWPATFPSGQGSDLAGVVEAVGRAVRNVAVGDEVIGFTNNRSSHAELVVVEADHLIGRPTHVSWEQAGALFVAGTPAYAAVHAVSLKAGDTVVISGAAGGVAPSPSNWPKFSALTSSVSPAQQTIPGLLTTVWSQSLMGKASRIGSEPHPEAKSMASLTPSAAAMWIWRSNSVSRPIGSIRSSTSRRPRNTVSRRRATARRRMPRCLLNSPA